MKKYKIVNIITSIFRLDGSEIEASDEIDALNQICDFICDDISNFIQFEVEEVKDNEEV